MEPSRTGLVLALGPEERVANFVCLVCEKPLDRTWTYFRCEGCQFPTPDSLKYRLHSAKPYKPATHPEKTPM